MGFASTLGFFQLPLTKGKNKNNNHPKKDFPSLGDFIN
jgi:hypothetical protein